MSKNILQRSFTIFVLIAAILASAGCAAGGQVGSSPTPTLPPPPTPTQTPQPTATATPLPPPTETPQPEAVAPELSSINSNVDKLDSFRLNMTFKVKGTDADDKVTDMTMTLVQEVVRASKSIHFAMSGFNEMFASSGLDVDSMEIYQLDKSSYLIMKAANQATPTCMSFTGEEATFDESAMDPGTMMKDITPGALIARGEMVNGVKTDHYNVENAGVGFGDVKSASGEVWIAQDGGYAVRFTGEAEGTFDLATTLTGNMTWSYDLKDINQTFTIELPAICASQQSALGDLPLPDNATKVNSLGQMITFSSPDKPDVVAQYFRTNLPGKGWKITEDSAMGASLVMLTVQKDSQVLSVMIAADDQSGGSSVIITPKE